MIKKRYYSSSRKILILILLMITLSRMIPASAQDRQHWHGYEILDSTLDGRNIKIVFPDRPNENRDWIWRARFWGHEPQTDLALLEHGFHVAYIDVAGLFGNKEAVGIWEGFYAWATKSFRLNQKVVLEGMSRGGLIIYNWARQNTDKVACIYGDAPVCDFKSWPLGNGMGQGSETASKVLLTQYRYTEEQALESKENPVDHLEVIARAQIPILHVVGDADVVVPVSENTALMKARLIELGWDMQVLHKPGVGHHPHSLIDPKPIVDFILIHTGNRKPAISPQPEWSMNNLTLRSEFRNCKIRFEQQGKGHVAFIGGSITEMNGYRPMISSYLEESFPHTEFTFTNAGISSTGSTTGAFRMERDVLSHGPLDLLFVEFAVNDDQDAEDSHLEAMLGMEGIIRKARKHNPDVDIVMTFFVNPAILEDYQKGIIRTSVAAHMEVAKHYGISTCNFAKEIADQITAGTLVWETIRGTHPNEYGNAICKNMICSMLEEAWSEKEVFEQPEAINPNNFELGRIVDPSACNYSPHWSYSVPDWEKLEGKKRDRYMDRPVLWTTKAGAELKFEFSGTAIGAFMVSGPDAGTFEFSIDGGPFEEVDPYHQRFSRNLHYPQTVMFANDLIKGKHTLNLKVLKKSSGSGNAVRIFYFAIN